MTSDTSSEDMIELYHPNKIQSEQDESDSFNKYQSSALKKSLLDYIMRLRQGTVKSGIEL